MRWVHACRYKACEWRFLRFNFCDESLRPLLYSELSSELMQWVQSIIEEGFEFAGLKYTFLAFSSSQLQEHGVWMYCDPPVLTQRSAPTAHELRAQAGALSALRIPAKWAARLGQCFSTTAETIVLDSQDVRLAPSCDKRFAVLVTVLICCANLALHSGTGLAVHIANQQLKEDARTSFQAHVEKPFMTQLSRRHATCGCQQVHSLCRLRASLTSQVLA